ncbi:hypothetical protein BpHYR1_015397 [Brachionus plicatilis]|uniref:Mos1 transposase HTH domain-containing protein n=1 Tax=Brachionus plicatilis TaxID=10195 RepID=A0A3M7RRF6_BRAPC|nr:hypothetical protein BpHYR1_015397 [Brachionus plicatilis]
MRELVIEHYKNGKANSEIFSIMASKVSKRTISRWTKAFRENGNFFPKTSSGRPNSVSNHLNKIRVMRLAYKKRKIPLLKEGHDYMEHQNFLFLQDN